LRDGHAARRVHCAHTVGAIVTHSGHQDGGTFTAELFGHGMKEDVDGRPVAIHRSLIHEHNHVSLRHAPHFYMAVAGTDESASWRQKITRSGFNDVD
jgi:hypothetical protein